jgi:hypothetical protein
VAHTHRLAVIRPQSLANFRRADLWLLIRLSTERRAVPAQDELQPAPLATPLELEDHLGSELELTGWSRRGV